jgi:4-hydroxybenzoate polyprenyltransferase
VKGPLFHHLRARAIEFYFSGSVRSVLFALKVSRPGLWFQTLWLYLLPVAAQPRLDTFQFWLGTVFVTFPLNLLVYGWNDVVDRSIDRVNPRKDSFLFGARGTAADLARVPRLIAWVNVPFFLGLSILCGWRMALVLAGMVLVTALYNLPRHGLRTHPPFELFNQLGYLLILPFSILLNGTGPLPMESVGYLVLFCTHAHLMGEIMDVYPDRASGRRTIATVLGIVPAKGIAAALVFVEAALIGEVFRDYVLAGFLFLGGCWLAADIFIFRDQPYTRNQFLLFGAGVNAAGFASMAWVWSTGTLTRLPAP